ncbi:MAG: MBL fold metallo-hydrolase [Synergistaceae bacterium]|nr:MBL fold metallo-hydrolase [Synergistaceae bacterium]
MNKTLKTTLMLFVISLFLAAAARTFAFETLSPDAQLQITIFNVGKGDCILLRQGGKAMMIDTGYIETAPMVLSKLKDMGVISIDCLLLSHYDKDHVGGAGQIITELPVGEIYGPNYTKDKKAYRKYVEALKDKNIAPHILTEGAVKFHIGGIGVALYPSIMSEGMVSNDYSVICVVTFGEKRFVFMGDATDKRMTDFLRVCGPKYDFMKLPHHGMFLRNSAPFKELLKTTNPEYCVITDSPEYKDNKGLLLMLDVYGTKKTCQTRHGEISLTSDGQTITMEQTPANGQ